MMDKKTILKAENLEKVYMSEGEPVRALKGINLEIPEGDMVAIMGPSGSGKSTLLHLLGGIDVPTKGTVKIENTDIFNLLEKDLAKFRNKNIGFVFQFHHLLPEFSALENVIMPLLIYKQKNAEKKGKEILQKLSLSHRINHKPSQLSGGEQQRVAIGRAIINNPKILLADEPTGNLDKKNTETVIKILKDMNHQFNTTIVLATHDIAVAKNCNYIYYIEDGLIKEKISSKLYT